MGGSHLGDIVEMYFTTFKNKIIENRMDRWANLSSYVTSGKIILVAGRWIRSNVSLPFFYVKLYQAGAPYNKIDLRLLV